jgi:hypothetical protein
MWSSLLEGKNHAWGHWGGVEELHHMIGRKIPLPREEQQCLKRNVDKKEKQQPFFDHIDPFKKSEFLITPCFNYCQYSETAVTFRYRSGPAVPTTG